MLNWFDSDGVTPLGSFSMGKVGPGEDYHTKNGDYRHLVLKNTGATTYTDVEVTIRQIGDFEADDYTLIATGATPGVFQDAADGPLAIGALAPGASVDIWVDVVVPLVAAREVGQFAGLRATGSEA